MKERDHAYRSCVLRQKELLNIIEEHKRMKKQEKKQGQRNGALMMLERLR